MKRAEVDFANGNIFINGHIVAPLSLQDFLTTTNQHAIPVRLLSTWNEGGKTYGAGPVNLFDSAHSFGLSLIFQEQSIIRVGLTWQEGYASQKGYDTTEKELIADKNTLSKFLAKTTGKPPDEKEYNHDVFLFNWGRISVAASLQSVMVTLGISWNKVKT